MKPKPTSNVQLERFAYILRKLGFSVPKEGRTRRIRLAGANLGYLNPSVRQHGGVLGYRFGLSIGEKERDAAPDGWNHSKICREFVAVYDCERDDFTLHEGTAAGTRENTYLVVTNPLLAVQVLLKEGRH